MINYTETRPPTDSPSNSTSTSVGVFCHDRRGLSVRCRAGVGRLQPILKKRLNVRVGVCEYAPIRPRQQFYTYPAQSGSNTWEGVRERIQAKPRKTVIAASFPGGVSPLRRPLATPTHQSNNRTRVADALSAPVEVQATQSERWLLNLPRNRVKTVNDRRYQSCRVRFQSNADVCDYQESSPQWMFAADQTDLSPQCLWPVGQVKGYRAFLGFCPGDTVHGSHPATSASITLRAEADDRVGLRPVRETK